MINKNNSDIINNLIANISASCSVILIKIKDSINKSYNQTLTITHNKPTSKTQAKNTWQERLSMHHVIINRLAKLNELNNDTLDACIAYIIGLTTIMSRSILGPNNIVCLTN